MSWFILGLLSVIVFSIINVFDKLFLVQYVRSARIAMGILGFFSLLVLIIGLPFLHLNFALKPSLILILSGIFEAFYIYFYLEAIQGDEVGYMIPFFSLSPIITLFFSYFFFSSVFSSYSVVGSLIIILGIIFLTAARYGFKRPPLNKFFWYMIAAAILFACQGIALQYVGGYYNWEVELLISRAGVAIGALLIFGFKPSDYKVFLQPKNYIFFISEALYVVAVYLLIASIATGQAFYAYSMQNIQPLFVLILSYLFYKFRPDLLKEEFDYKSRNLAVFSICLIVAGAVLLKL